MDLPHLAEYLLEYEWQAGSRDARHLWDLGLATLGSPLIQYFFAYDDWQNIVLYISRQMDLRSAQRGQRGESDSGACFASRWNRSQRTDSCPGRI